MRVAWLMIFDKIGKFKHWKWSGQNCQIPTKYHTCHLVGEENQGGHRMGGCFCFCQMGEGRVNTRWVLGESGWYFARGVGGGLVLEILASWWIGASDSHLVPSPRGAWGAKQRWRLIIKGHCCCNNNTSPHLTYNIWPLPPHTTHTHYTPTIVDDATLPCFVFRLFLNICIF